MIPQPAVLTPGGMGPPPAKAPEKQVKGPEYDFTDSLAGTGIDLSQEERLAAEYSGSFTYQQVGRTGFPQLLPGGRSSFYGAGPANQPIEPVSDSQEKFEYDQMVQAWNASAIRLASSRVVELKKPTANINLLHARMEKIAQENGLSLNLDFKGNKPKSVTDQPANVKAYTRPSADGTATVTTYGSFVPQDSNLADQFSLLSIALKTRVSCILEDCCIVSKHRQTTAHFPPADWSDAAATLRSIHLGTEKFGGAPTSPKPVVPAKRRDFATISRLNLAY